MRYLFVLLWLLTNLPSRSQAVKIKNLHVAVDKPSNSVKINYDLVGNTKATVVKLTIYRADSTIINAPTLRGVREAMLSPHRSKVIYWDVVTDDIYANENFLFELSTERINSIFKPSVHWAVRGMAIGGAVGSWLIWNQFKTQLAQLNALSLEVDPDADGIIQDANLYARWHNQYSQTQEANKPKWLYACAGIAAVATIFEMSMVLHDAKTRRRAITIVPDKYGLGVGLNYHFSSKH